MKSYFITGATGFCGQHLCNAISHHGHKIVGTHFTPSEPTTNRSVHYISLDITDREKTMKAVKEAKPDYVIHLAAQTVPQKSWDLIDETFQTNIDGTVNVLEGVKQGAPDAKFLFISTNQVYGKLYRDKSSPSENDRIHPHNPYAVTKAIGETIVNHYQDVEKINATIARPFNHFGPGQGAGFVFSDWCKQIAEIELGKRDAKISVGNLKLKRDVLSVHDIVSAYEVLCEKGQSGESYNVCTENAISLEDAMSILAKFAKKKFEVFVDEGKLRAFDPPEVTGSAKKIRDLGWAPKVSLEDALMEMLADWRERIEKSE